jgi:glutamate racemase
MTSKLASPIGIFDSGIGGLTVAKAVMEVLPHENIIYFGDTARVPYGNKSEETIRRYSNEITRFLKRKDVKLILIACNSVSAVAKESVIQSASPIPVLDVITAGTLAALNTGTKKIGVIGTLATIGSGAYELALLSYDKKLDIISKACPLLVSLAEEGWTDNAVAARVLSIYLDEFRDNGIESLILGCTHYPLFKQIITSLFTHRIVEIIDSADAIARMTKELLESEELVNHQRGRGSFECYVSDHPQRFHELAERFLGRPVQDVQVVNPFD